MTCARRFALRLMALVAVALFPASSAGQPAFDGVYIAYGVDSAGVEYRRAVDIEQRGDRFIVTWVSARVVGEAIVLEPTWVGVGIAAGNALSVSFVATDTLGLSCTNSRRTDASCPVAGPSRAMTMRCIRRL